MENIFITGATGYIGSNLVLKLADSDKIVHALYRSKSKASSLDHKNISIQLGIFKPKSRKRIRMES
ncbi:MAG: NAD-dependent epimerase/dehydratase family protein [Bacteroidetes bacterium]|nr:NAD-dependent epimerase/dehydratase family protein [Bacteroidota bacterium]